MMKKIVVTMLILVLTVLTFSCNSVHASNELLSEQTGQMLKMKEKTSKEMEQYKQKYNSETYGMTAFILNKIRIFSIPFCFVGILVGVIYQYILGAKRLDKIHKGFNLILTFVTILVLCQILPLIFAIIVINWRG